MLFCELIAPIHFGNPLEYFMHANLEVPAWLGVHVLCLTETTNLIISFCSALTARKTHFPGFLGNYLACFLDVDQPGDKANQPDQCFPSKQGKAQRKCRSSLKGKSSSLSYTCCRSRLSALKQLCSSIPSAPQSLPLSMCLCGAGSGHMFRLTVSRRCSVAAGALFSYLLLACLLAF